MAPRSQCFPVQQVIVSLPLGHPLATAGGQNSSEHRSGTPNMLMQMLVDNPQEVIQLLRSAKDALMSANLGFLERGGRRACM